MKCGIPKIAKLPMSDLSFYSNILQQPVAKIADSVCKFMTDPEKLLSSLSYSHLVLLVKIGDSFKRFFYECELCRMGQAKQTHW